MTEMRVDLLYESEYVIKLLPMQIVRKQLLYKSNQALCHAFSCFTPPGICCKLQAESVVCYKSHFVIVLHVDTLIIVKCRSLMVLDGPLLIAIKCLSLMVLDISPFIAV